MENVHVGAPAAGKAGAPPPVQQPYGQPPPHQHQQQPYGHPQQPYGHPQQHQHQQQVYGQPSASGAPPQQPYGQTATPTKPPPQVVVSPPYRDVVFAGLFVVHLFVILVLAFALGVPALSRADDNTTSKVDVSDTHPIIGLLVVAGIVGAVLSSLWVMFLQRNARTIVTCTLWTSVILELACAVVVMFISPGAGVIFLFLAAITLCYVYAVRRRIPFASANLATACAAVTDHPQVVYTAFGALVVQVLWVVFWSMAFFGVEANSTDDGYICEFFMLISFFWGLLVIKNIVHCTTAGTVGSWWFVANPQKPVMGAVKRAMTTSLGSICLGSLVVAVLKAMRVMIDSARRGSRRSGGGGAFLLACASCLVRCVERMMEYFNHWAFVQVALYGKDFRTAGGDAIRVFKERGWTLIINDNLIDRALTLGCIMVGCVTGLVGAGWAVSMVDDGGWVFAGAFLSFLVGFGMCMIVTSVIDSAVATVFVCFAEHPDALAATHPDQLGALVGAWQQFHPQAFSGAGYDVRFGRPGAV